MHSCALCLRAHTAPRALPRHQDAGSGGAPLLLACSVPAMAAMAEDVRFHLEAAYRLFSSMLSTVIHDWRSDSLSQRRRIARSMVSTSNSLVSSLSGATELPGPEITGAASPPCAAVHRSYHAHSVARIKNKIRVCVTVPEIASTFGVALIFSDPASCAAACRPRTW